MARHVHSIQEEESAIVCAHSAQGYAFQMEIVVRARILDYSIAEVRVSPCKVLCRGPAHMHCMATHTRQPTCWGFQASGPLIMCSH